MLMCEHCVQAAAMTASIPCEQANTHLQDLDLGPDICREPLEVLPPAGLAALASGGPRTADTARQQGFAIGSDRAACPAQAIGGHAGQGHADRAVPPQRAQLAMPLACAGCVGLPGL